MFVRFNDPGIYEESMTDSEVMRRNKISQHQQNQNQIYMKTNEPSDIDTDVFTGKVMTSCQKTWCSIKKAEVACHEVQRCIIIKILAL